MNNKIPLKKFAEVFAQDLNISESDAEFFIKLLFETVSAELREGNKVTIRGIGTFSITDSGSEPVGFIADDTLAEDVNAPFSIFSPVTLEEGVTEEILKDVETPAIPVPEQEELSLGHTDSEHDEIQVVPVTIQEPVISTLNMPAEQEANTTEQDEAEVSLIAPEETEEPDSDNKTKIIEENIEPEIPEKVEEEHREEAVPQIAEENPVQTPDTPKYEWEYEEEEYVEHPQQQSSKFGSGFIIGLIVGLAIGALVLCGYIMYFVNAHPSGQSVDTELIEAPAHEIQ